jgi:hypothetical protein
VLTPLANSIFPPPPIQNALPHPWSWPPCSPLYCINSLITRLPSPGGLESMSFDPSTGILTAFPKLGDPVTANLSGRPKVDHGLR